MFRKRRDTAQPPDEFFYSRLRKLVRETLEPPVQEIGATDSDDPVPDAMALLVEFRGAFRRGTEPAVPEILGPELRRYVSDVYRLEFDLQMPCLEAIVESRRHELAGDLDEAVASCKRGLNAAPEFLPLLARAAALERQRGDVKLAETHAVRLLDILDRRGEEAAVAQLCKELVEQHIDDLVLLEACGRRLEAAGESAFASRVWQDAARRLARDGRYLDALGEIDRALALSPNDSGLYLELADLYEHLNEQDQASAALLRAEDLAVGDADALTRVLLLRAKTERPDERVISHLMDLLEPNRAARQRALGACEQAVADAPYNPHLPYIHGVLLALDGKAAAAQRALKTAAERYSAIGDRAGELDARRAIEGALPKDLENRRRVAELLFELGDVKGAMESLAALARIARREGIVEPMPRLQTSGSSS
ncbi:MAG: hypothetical protein IT307_00205 [Chloroflexi bacterium]|nr:hypothetical protein [Chloroflexota bacterium]